MPIGASSHSLHGLFFLVKIILNSGWSWLRRLNDDNGGDHEWKSSHVNDADNIENLRATKENINLVAGKPQKEEKGEKKIAVEKEREKEGGTSNDRMTLRLSHFYPYRRNDISNNGERERIFRCASLLSPFQFFLLFLEVEGAFLVLLLKSRRTLFLQRGHLGSLSESITYIRQIGHPARTIGVFSGLDFPSSDSEETQELGGEEDEEDEVEYLLGEMLIFLILRSV